MAQSICWQSALRQALLKDPTKTSVMGVLLLVLIGVCVHALMPGAEHPVAAMGSVTLPNNAPLPTSVSMSSPSLRRTNPAIRAWLGAPAPALSRNDFLIRMDDFPIDPLHPAAKLSDGSFWTGVEKLLAIQTDQQEQRRSAIKAIEAQAEFIRPQSTMMGIHPRAMVNGSLLGEGDMIDGFCLLRIEPRGIIVQRDGVKLEVPMRQ